MFFGLGGNDDRDERGNTGLGREKMHSVSTFHLFLFRRTYLWDSITGPFSNMNPYYTPVFQKRFSSRRKQDRKKVIRPIHHIHSTR